MHSGESLLLFQVIPEEEVGFETEFALINVFDIYHLGYVVFIYSHFNCLFSSHLGLGALFYSNNKIQIR